MGVYFNPSNEKFEIDLNAEIYVDKSNLIQYTNKVIKTPQRFVCVSRPRRFGKSMAANMLAAYYSRGCDSRGLFRKLKISGSLSYQKRLNQYDVIAFNMQEFLSSSKSVDEMLHLLSQRILWELLEEYPDYRYFDKTDLIGTMQDIYQNSRIPFVVIIDEWDCIFREYKKDSGAQRRYLDFLRNLLKDKAYIHLAYMTGILPIKKYGTHSALNMFDEFSMIFAGPLAEYVGFTAKEVKDLCESYHISFEDMKDWYDGYRLKGVDEIYNPRSVVSCIQFGEFGNYWNQTENYEALQFYIDMNMEGLADDIIEMLQGHQINVNSGTFQNDMATFAAKDDILTLLIHLGYLGYDFDCQQAFIPNHEIINEFENAVRVSDWGEVSKALQMSKHILQAVWEKDSQSVADGIAASHLETAHIQYNDENALSYTISLAFFAARNYYTVVREFPSGKRFADLVFLPRKKYADRPAILVELKWKESAESALAQIKRKKYGTALQEYHGNLLLVGISYDKKTRKHYCKIEEYQKK